MGIENVNGEDKSAAKDISLVFKMESDKILATLNHTNTIDETHILKNKEEAHAALSHYLSEEHDINICSICKLNKKLKDARKWKSSRRG